MGATVSGFTVSPATVGVGSDGHPLVPLTLTLSAVGLTPTGWFPATWSDDTGSHQVTMMPGGAGTWTATVPTSRVTRAVPAGQPTATVVFAATAPGTRAVPTTTLTVRSAPALGTCAVAPNPVLLRVLTTTTAGAETLTCSATGLTAAGDVTVTYPTPGAGTATGHLTSTDGASWRLVLPAGTVLRGPLTEVFTFTPVRADGLAGTVQAVSAVLL